MNIETTAGFSRQDVEGGEQPAQECDLPRGRAERGADPCDESRFDLQLTHGAMSDIPAMALWTVVLALLPRLSRNSALLAGVVAGTAILVRPNLAPLALVPGAFLVWNAAAKRQARPLPFSDCCSSESDRCPHASWSPI
jgi:hypothetical protein